VLYIRRVLRSPLLAALHYSLDGRRCTADDVENFDIFFLSPLFSSFLLFSREHRLYVGGGSEYMLIVCISLGCWVGSICLNTPLSLRNLYS